MSGRTQPVTSQDSLAAEVLLSLCPSGFRETGNDVGDGVVESAAPLPVEEPLQSAGALPIDQPMEPVELIPDEQVTLQRHHLVHSECCCLLFWALLLHAFAHAYELAGVSTVKSCVIIVVTPPGYGSMCNSMIGLIACLPYLLQKELCQTERTLSIPLVDSRGYGHMAAMDPAGSAVLDQIFDGAGHLLEAMEAN